MKRPLFCLFIFSCFLYFRARDSYTKHVNFTCISVHNLLKAERVIQKPILIFLKPMIRSCTCSTARECRAPPARLALAIVRLKKAKK